MSRVVYTSVPQTPVSRLISPYWIVRNLLRHRELIAAYTKREFHAVYRGTYLGLAWSVISPLIMLALFTLVFGYIFGGRFSHRPDESPADFALALFIGLSFFQVLGQSMGTAPSLVLSNSNYVKTLDFPLEILSVSAVLNVLVNLAIGLVLCFAAFLVMYGRPHVTVVLLPLYVLCIALTSLGISWFLSSLGVFMRDVPAIVTPMNTILMFVSGVFFPLSAVSPRIRGVLELNPLAILIEQARSCFLYGLWPNFVSLGLLLILSGVIAVGGYWFFMRAKPAFSDVI